MAGLSVVSDRSITVTNEEFLRAIFGDEWVKVHVTSFVDDPSAIAQDRRAICWAGGSAGERLQNMKPEENQYFTISLFHRAENGKAVRRKAQFDACFVIVADDVAEKLPLDRVEMLPEPSYKLVTSKGSEQWAWILKDPCDSRPMVENLLDGLVAKGLAPDGNDPGMKGVTRYVRMPSGSNTKAKRFIGGKPFKCYLTSWEPKNLYLIDELAKVFDIDLYAERAEASIEALAVTNPWVAKHPIFKHVVIDTVGNDNWIRIDCVNAEAHSVDDPTGAAIRIAPDGSVQYQCHHGHCNGDGEKRKVTGTRAIEILDEKLGANGSFIAEVNAYKMDLALERTIVLAEALGEPKGPTDTASDFEVDEVEKKTPEGFDPMRYIFIAPDNSFYDIVSGMTLPPKGLDNLFLRQLPGGKAGPTASKLLLSTMDPSVSSADGIGWKPENRFAPDRQDLIFEDAGRRLVNTWRGFELTPVAGDVSRWLKLAEYLIPNDDERNVVLDFLAFLVQRPAEKPSFCIVHRGTHRIGKDLLYLPVMRALGTDIARGVSIDNLMNGWGDYTKGLRMAIVEEVDKAQDHRVANSMKTLLAPTATGKRILNLKGGKVLIQVDCTGYVMMSNKRACIAIEPNDRRYFVVDSWVEPKQPEYYQDIDAWYRRGGGPAAVLDYLLNRDISGFAHAQLPKMTAGALEMVRLGRYDYEQDLEVLIDEGHPPFHCNAVSVKDLKRVCREHGLKGGNNGIEEAMRHQGWIKFTNVVAKIDGKSVKAPTFFGRGLPEGASMREAFDFYQMQTAPEKVT